MEAYYQKVKGEKFSPIESITKLTNAMELTIRGHDQLDEALHAGYFFYILVGTSRFVGIDSFIYPVALTTFSHFLPVIHNYYNYMYETKKNALNFVG